MVTWISTGLVPVFFLCWLNTASSASAMTWPSGNWIAVRYGVISVGHSNPVPPEFTPGFFATEHDRASWWEYVGPRSALFTFDLLLLTALVFLFAALLWGIQLWEAAFSKPRPGHCAKCGYDRGGLPTRARCPECGQAAGGIS